MKRLLTLVLALVLLTLSACYRPANTEPPAPEQLAVTPVDTAATDKKAPSTPTPPAVEVNDRSRAVTPVGSAERLTLIEQLSTFDRAKAEATDLPLYVQMKWETPLPEDAFVQASLYYLDGDELVCLQEYMTAQDKGRDCERAFFFQLLLGKRSVAAG